AKNDLKKPMSFSILNYMNWIVPVSLSLAFMVAYPSIRTLWHSDEASSSVIENQEKEQIAPISELNSPISSVDVSEQSNETNAELTVNEVIQYNKTNKLSSNTKKVVSNNSIDETFNTIILETEKKSVTKAMNSSLLADNERILAKDDKEKSIIDFGNRAILKEEVKSEQLDFLSAYPNNLNVDYVLNTKKIDDLLARKKGFSPYMTFTIVPLSMGNDLAKTTTITIENQLIRNIPVANNNEIIISNPKSFGVETDVHLSELFRVGTGFIVTNRNVLYSTMNGGNTTDLDIQYRTYSVPFMAVLKMPLGASGLNTLNIKGGATVNWMGEMNYQSNHTGSIDLEKNNTASLFNTNGLTSELVTTNDALTFVPSLQFGLEYTRKLRIGQVSFALDYNRQMSNINTISVWDYDIDTQFRSNQTLYNMRYESVTASVKYTLPYRWYLKRK
ncbi:MAG: hypothetical protein ACPGXZ_15780, partial [Saprospiraceae bacterium]